MHASVYASMQNQVFPMRAPAGPVSEPSNRKPEGTRISLTYTPIRVFPVLYKHDHVYVQYTRCDIYEGGKYAMGQQVDKMRVPYSKS